MKLSRRAALVAEEVKALKEQAAQRMGQRRGRIWGRWMTSSLPDELFTEEANRSE